MLYGAWKRVLERRFDLRGQLAQPTRRLFGRTHTAPSGGSIIVELAQLGGGIATIAGSQLLDFFL
jgi:hypothetical protein